MKVVQQTYHRRLMVAVLCTLLFHLGLILMMDWGLALREIPSNEDRPITLSLQKSESEGINDLTEPPQETVNSDVGKFKATPVNQAERLTENHAARIQTDTAAVAPPIESQSITSETISNSLAQDEGELWSAGEITQFSDTDEASSPQAFISRVEPNVMQVADHKNQYSGRLSPTQTQEPIQVAIDPKQQRAIQKKVAQFLAGLDNTSELTEPFSWQSQKNTYRASIKYTAAENEMGIDKVAVEVITESDGEQLSTTLRYKQLVFSNFAQFVDQWNKNTVIHDDEMDGRFHSNTKIRLVADHMASPVFHGKFTTAAYGLQQEGRVLKKDVFLGGIETRVKRIKMPKFRTLVPDSGLAKSEVFVVHQDSKIKFMRDGYLLHSHLNYAGPPRKVISNQAPLYVMAAPGVTLHVEGVVNGLVTVFASKRILITGNIDYESRSPIAQDGDFLGLVSGQNVQVASRDIIADGDLNIDASIYAKGRFGVNRISGKRAGTLNIYGSLSVGTLTATEPRYATKITFDRRLENQRPPSFPVTNRYELLAEDHKWTLKQSPFLDMENAE